MFTSSEIARVLRRKFEFEDVKGKKKEIYLSLKLPGVEPVITHGSQITGSR